jgi:integrase
MGRSPTGVVVRLGRAGPYWTGRWRDREGTRRSRCLGRIGEISKAEAERRVATLAAKLALSPIMRRGAIAPTIAEWRADFFSRTKLAEDTVATITHAVGMLESQMGATRRLDKITRDDAAQFVAWLAVPQPKKKPRSEQTVRKIVRHLKAWMRAAQRADLIDVNPFDRIASGVLRTDDRKVYVTPESADMLIREAQNNGWACLIALCRFAGLRRGEAMRVAWADVDFHHRTLTVQHEGQHTTKKRRRVVPVVPRLYDVLRRAFDEATPGARGPCDGVGDNNVIRDFTVRAKSLGIVMWERPFHSLRASAESDWLKEYPPADVARWLGHSITVAMQHYHQTTPEVWKRATTGQSEVESLRAEIERLRAGQQRAS